jgi:TolB protein
VRITSDSVGNADPRVSPDGRLIAHMVRSIVRVITTTGVTVFGGRYAGASGFEYVGPWSPDGAYLTMTGNLGRVGLLSVLRTSDWSTARSINGVIGFCSPIPETWSPDSRTVLHTVSGCAPPRPVYALDVSSGARPLLTAGGAARPSPAWSPNSQRIALVQDAPGGADIYLINPDGTGAVNLTNLPAGYSSPQWSPDGSKIAFVGTRGGASDLWAMNADGGGLLRLTNDAATEGAFTWAPGGDRIAFATNRDGNEEIYVVRADGTGLTNLTRSPGDDYSPQWSR